MIDFPASPVTNQTFLAPNGVTYLWDGRTWVAVLTPYVPNDAGKVDWFAMAAPPVGWLKCNGAAVSRVLYANLFAAIGVLWGPGDGSQTFNLPELRGEFPRALDDGRGIDTGRAIGTAQVSQNLSHDHGFSDPTHSHTGYTTVAGNHSHAAGGSPTGVIDGNQGYGMTKTAGYANSVWITSMRGDYRTEAVGDHQHNIQSYGSGTGISFSANGGTEARPRNVALLACIRY